MIGIVYTGVDKAGRAQTERTDVVSIAGFVRRRHQAGWLSLSVYRAGSVDGACVGTIVRNDSGRRVAWWASS